jgi:hypothetical protein
MPITALYYMITLCYPGPGLSQWDPRVLPRENLEKILQQALPSRQIVEQDDFAVECAICYTYRLDGAIPDIVCDNRRCESPLLSPPFSPLTEILSVRLGADTCGRMCGCLALMSGF